MIVEKVGVAGRPPKVTRYLCTVCGEHYDSVRLGDRDALDHQCPRAFAGAWWIVRRAAA